jgi:hypothetical protein
MLPVSAGDAPAELTEEELDAMDTEKAATDTQYEARAASDASFIIYSDRS